MSAIGDNPEFRRLRVLWEKWLVLVSQAARPGMRRRRVTEARLARVRQPLLRLCSEVARSTTDGEKRRLVLRMYELVEPWTNANSFTSVEREYLASLISESRELGRKLKGRRGIRRRLPPWTTGLVVIAAVAVLIWLAGDLSPAFDWIRYAVRTAAGMLQSTSFVQRFALGTFLVIAGGIFLLQRSRRY